MKSFVYSLFTVVVLLFCYPFLSKAQDKTVNPTFIGHGIFLGETPPLRDIPPMTEEEYQQMAERARKKMNNQELEYRSYPYAETALPKGPDEAWQRTMGTHSMPKAPIVNFSGQTSSYYPSDCNGTAGPNHYMQTINCAYAIYNKQTGALIAGPTAMNTLFSGTTGSNYNDGDPLILYDEMAGRWLAVEFSISGSNDYMLIAVSSTNDPTGTWYKYSFDVADMPDYEKFGIWQDGYYMGDNNSSGNDIYVFQRSVMLTGGASPLMIGFDNPYRPTTIDGFVCVPPVDNDGTAAPSGAPGTFIAFNDDAIGGGSDQLWIYELTANWTTPSSSTFSRVQQINVTAFDSNFGNNWDNITQPNSQKLDAIPQVIMNVPQYRNFGSYQTIVCCHTVDVDATNHAGIRWYELRRGTQTSGNWTIRQQGTYAPDSHNRWMGSIMLNGSGKIALGYSISSSTVYPGIRYTGQSASAYSAGSGVMDIPEDIIQTATTAQTSYNRWGDYALMSVDPTDDQTFWFTTQYGGSRQTKIASFKFGNDPAVTTLPATSVTASTALLNGTVNPNSLATSYYFQWGTTTSYGNNTSTLSAGSGTSSVAVNAGISGLTSGTTYHFRLVATNSDGTAYGSDLTFTPGAASVTTTAASSITLSTATSGGNVITDGGSTVTARGVCWATTSNPTVSGNHTTDGSGTGTFTSQITGLSSNTTYHVRAYATNANGTYYGEDLTFTTLCGIFSLPFTETFSGTTIPSCWSQVDNQGNGQVWQFGTITGYSPNPSLTGNYAYLNSDAYGSGNTQNADLITPTLDLSTFTNVTLQFQHYFRSYTGSSGTLKYSINNGSTWTTIQSYTATTANPATFSQVIAAVAGYSQVKFKWNYTGTYGYYWAIDNVQITGTASPTLSVTPSNQNVMPSAGSTSFAVTSNSSWNASSNQTWCTVTSSGTGNGTIIANYTANPGSTQRTATITVTVTGLTPVTVTVTQAAPTLTVTPSNQSVDSPAGSTSFTVTSNTGWIASSDQLWCISTAAGSGSGSITADYEENTLASQRIATITVAVTGLSPINVTVTQAAAPPTLTVTPSNRNVTDAAGSTTFNVTSNASWTASSDQTWCTVTASGTGNGNINANFEQNLSVDPRVAHVTVTVSGLAPVVVTVSQTGAAPILTVTPANRDVADAAGSTTFSVTSNTQWASSSDQTWCTVTTSGIGNGSINANFEQNLSVDPRVAHVTVTVSGLTPVVVTVSQAGAAPILTVTPANSDVADAAGSTTFSVVSNTQWTASSDQTWCAVTTSGTGNGSISASFEQNLTVDPRVAHITVTVSGLAPVVVTVSQAGATPILTVTPANRDVADAAGNTTFSVVSNTQWTASSDQTWCTVTTSGIGNGSINANFEQNFSVDPRVAQVTVSVSGLTPVVVTVSQAGATPILTVTPANRDVADAAGNTTFSVVSNTQWTASSDQNWCAVTTSGMGNGSISATFEQNLTVDPRVAHITVTVSGLAPVVVTVSQTGAAPILTVTPANRDVADAAGSTTFSVVSNTQWTASSDQTWCTVTTSGIGNGSINANFEQNFSVDPRVAHITVTVSGLAPVVVTVSQDGSPVKTLIITAFPEGFYNGSSLNQVQDVNESGDPVNNFAGTTVDTMSVYLAASVMPWEFIFGIHSIAMNSNGSMTAPIPPAYSGNYYIVLKHRQSVETWSSNPVSFAGSTIIYSFTTSAGQAFGNNLKDLLGNGSVWGLYTGDMNQDGFVELDDVNAVYSAQKNGLNGYLIWDINGNGFVELDDVNKVYINNRNSIGVHNPTNP